MSAYRRQAQYWHRGSLTRRGTPNPIVLGRKFCARCGHWRHVCDFSRSPRNTRSGLYTYCQTCVRIMHRERRVKRTEAQLLLDREYQRFWYEARRRAAGVAPRAFQNRKSVIDHPERVFLDPAPLVALLTGYENGALRTLALSAGVSERGLHRLLHGESHHVRLDTADKLAVALGTTLSLLYLDAA